MIEVVKGEKRTSTPQVLPGLHPGAHGPDGRDLAHRARTRRRSPASWAAASEPTPIDDDEVARMTQQIKEGAVKPKPKIRFEEGENVRVVDGPFANFSGFVDEVLPDKEKVRVMVQVFGRATPVMLDYTKVEKA